MREGAEPPSLEPGSPAGSESPPPLLRPSQAPRASQAPARWKGWWRILFAVAWVGVQIALVITADRRPDGAFGFRMFTESSTMKVVLHREVIGADGRRTLVHVEDGVWSARDAGGLVRSFAWTDRVRRRELAVFDKEVNANYGANAVLARLKAALDDVATHQPDDADTRRFLLDVTIRRNAREPYVVHLASAERPGGP